MLPLWVIALPLGRDWVLEPIYSTGFALQKRLCGFGVSWIYLQWLWIHKKQKGFRDGPSYSTPQKDKETRGNAITQPRSNPILKFRDGMGFLLLKWHGVRTAWPELLSVCRQTGYYNESNVVLCVLCTMMMPTANLGEIPCCRRNTMLSAKYHAVFLYA